MSEFSKESSPVPGLARTAIAASATAWLGVVWAHGMAAMLRGFSSVDAGSWSVPLTTAALFVAVAAALLSRKRLAWRTASLAGLVTWLGLTVVMPDARVVFFALVPVAAMSAVFSRWLIGRLPGWLDAAPTAKRLRSMLWLSAALIAVVQIARLSTWTSDPSSDWFLSTRDPFYAKHGCLSAYLYGAELGLRGEANVYDAAHYPGLTPEAKPRTSLSDMTVEDPFQYAPQFLLWPAAALHLSHDYLAIRGVWFALQATAFLAGAAALAWWIGGPAGRLGLLLLPVALSAFPTLHDLQYGQFHLAAILLALGAMIAFDKRRDKTGGALLAVSVLSKLFPGILLFVLLAQRRWRALGWTAAWGALLTIATLATFGTAPFAAFFGYHLPRLGSGAAFAFGEAWPELRSLVLAANQGVYGLVLKLGEMGVAGADESVAAWANRVYAVGLVGGAWLLGRRLGDCDREQRAIAWLSFVGLASLVSTGAFADYVPVTAIWLLTLLARRVTSRAARYALVGVCCLQYFLVGTMPVGTWFDPSVAIPLSAVSASTLLGLFGWSIARVARASAPSRAGASDLRAAPASG